MFSCYLSGVSHVSTGVHCLLAYCCASPREVWLCLLCICESGSCRQKLGLPWAFSRLNTALCAVAPWPAWWHLLDLLQHVSIFLVLNRPKPDMILRTWSHKCQIERKDHYTFSNAAQVVVGLLCCEGTLLIHVQIVVHYVPCLQIAGPSLYSGTGLFYAGCRTLSLLLMKSIKFLSTHFCSLLKSFWLASPLSSGITTSCNLVSSPNLLRVHPTLSSFALTPLQVMVTLPRHI